MKKKLNTKGKTECKHKWQVVGIKPEFPYYVVSGGNSGGGGGVHVVNDVIAVCVKCLEKRYL
jgi:hypothetical protein